MLDTSLSSQAAENTGEGGIYGGGKVGAGGGEWVGAPGRTHACMRMRLQRGRQPPGSGPGPLRAQPSKAGCMRLPLCSPLQAEADPAALESSKAYL